MIATMRKKPGSDRHKNPKETFHLSPELQRALEEYRDSTRPRPDKSEICRTALEDFLRLQGFWPVEDK